MRRVLNLLKALFNQTKYLIKTNKYLTIVLVVLSVFAIDRLGNWECVTTRNRTYDGYVYAGQPSYSYRTIKCDYKEWFWIWESNKPVKTY